MPYYVLELPNYLFAFWKFIFTDHSRTKMHHVIFHNLIGNINDPRAYKLSTIVFDKVIESFGQSSTRVKKSGDNISKRKKILESSNLRNMNTSGLYLEERN
uniref:Uncharacterized protein n=1 Tax=Cacopsylla melanoneura TaxID=428564 RepID=A0A8D8Z081_9HEMI